MSGDKCYTCGILLFQDRIAGENPHNNRAYCSLRCKLENIRFKPTVRCDNPYSTVAGGRMGGHVADVSVQFTENGRVFILSSDGELRLSFRIPDAMFDDYNREDSTTSSSD